MKRQCLSFGILFMYSSLLCSAGWASLQGGFAKIDITPPLGIPLIGSKGQPSDAILDDLYAKAMDFYDGHLTVAIVSADLLYAPLEEITGPVRRLIREKTGIPESNILICATHTHSGPEVFTLSKLRPEQRVPLSRIDSSYLQTLVRKMADTVQIALRNLQPIKIGLANGSLPELLFNRRTQKPDGSVVMTFSVAAEIASTQKIEKEADGTPSVSFTLPEPNANLRFGPVDPRVWILRVEDEKGNLVGSMLNYACHPVCIYPSMPTTLSADYPGDATGLVEATEGGICLFTLGTAGDMVPYQRGLEAHKRMGKALGGEAVRKLQFVRTTDDVILGAHRKEIHFPAKSPLDSNGQVRLNEPPEIIKTEIQVLKLSDYYFLALPGEVLAEVGLEIRKQAGLENLVLISMGNDIVGYICHDSAYDQGGYEPGTATYLEKGAGRILVEESLALLGRIQASK